MAWKTNIDCRTHLQQQHQKINKSNNQGKFDDRGQPKYLFLQFEDELTLHFWE